MAQKSDRQLDEGDAFPRLDVDLVDGSSLSLPSEGWTIVIFYRGEW